MDEILLSSGLETEVASGDFSMWVILPIIIVGLVFVGIAIALIRRMLNRPELHGLTREKIQEKWTEIEKISDTGLMGKKMAIVEADKLLDGALKSMMMPGDTMAERLKVASYKYPELKKVWFAHKLRNQIVHEPTFEISDRQGKSAIIEYRKALRVIHVL